MLEENREAGIVILPDKLGNNWQGIKMSVFIRKNDKYKGLTLDFYYLTLPGTPVLCSVFRVHQNTGRHFPWYYMEKGIFLKTDPEILNNRLQFITMDGDRLRMTAGKNQYYIRTNEPILFESPNRKEKLLVYTDTENQWLEAGVNSSLLMAFTGIRRELRNNEKITVPPTFLIFTEEYINAGLLQDLKNIRFDYEGERYENH
jgi:hypothetical protein